MSAINKRQRACFKYKSQKKLRNVFISKKSWHFSKRKTISVTFWFTRSLKLYVAQFFIKFLKLAFIYKKYDNFCYVMFLYTKFQTLRKKQDNLRYVFIYKKPNTFCYAIFHGIFEIGEEGGIFLCKKQCILCYTFIYKNNALCVTFLNTKS